MRKTQKQKIGKTGEDIACRFLEKRGLEVVQRNYLKKWGEIDIIARELNTLHFVEVKTVSRDLSVGDFARDTGEYRPEDNLHPWKLKRLSRTIQTYLLEKGIGGGERWRFDVLVVFLDKYNKKARVRFLENVIL